MTSGHHDRTFSDPNADAPLSYSQRRLWLLDQIQPKTSVHNVVRAYRLDGPLEGTVLEEALRRLRQRHEGLTTTFLDNTPGQQRQPGEATHWSLTREDYTTRGEALEAALAREAARPFDLALGPLFRATLFRLADHHVLLLAMHSAAADEASADSVVAESILIYEGLLADQPPALSTLTELAAPATPPHWGKSLDALVASLEGAPGHMELSADFDRPEVFRYAGRVEPLNLDAELASSLARLAAQRGVDLPVVLLTAFKVFLARYSGQCDICVGEAVTGRRAEHAGRVGAFSNTVVVRTTFSDETRFSELLAEVNRARKRALAHQDIPFSVLVDRLNPPRDRSRTPLFQAHFGLRHVVTPPAGPSGLELTEVRVHAGGAKTDLSLDFEVLDERIEGHLEYASDLIAPETARLLVANFETLLRGIARDPETTVARLPITSPAEAELLAQSNATACHVPDVAGFDELIWAQARRTPDRIAVASDTESFTYAELAHRSRAVACRLAEQGIARGSRVGILVERRSALVAAALGVVQAGAAYVPLDADYPRDRLEYMLADADLKLVIADASLRDRLPKGSFTVLELDEIGPASSTVALPSDRSPSDIAYVIYTSGTTGRPKGVQVPHGAVVNFLASMALEPGCTDQDSVIAVTTLSFDIAVLELYLPLTVGARTFVVASQAAADGAALAKVLEEQQATLMQATPTTWRVLIDAGFTGRKGFRALCGGEPLPLALARDLLPRTSALWNMYGPTETTVWSTCQLIANPSDVLIGHPIANTEVYIVDKHLVPVPFGASGELCIGGRGVTAGYLNRSELTRDRFVPDPFSSVPGARLYRTGDLARQRRGGLQCLGRSDGQVKIRGHRIELAEIEAVVGADPHVAQCVVEARELAPGDVRLVAYVVTAPGSSLDSMALRNFARTRLPEYMVPQHVVELDALPLTPNGKINRKALPMPSSGKPKAAEPGRASNATEALVQSFWQEVLSAKDIGVNDKFFDVGGHSLTAVRLINRINEVCQLSLPLAVIFEAPTIALQAKRIDFGHHADGISVVPLQPAGTQIPLFCICGIGLYHTLAKHLGTDFPTYGVFLPIESRILDGSAAPLSVAEMASDYAKAIRSRQPVGPYCLAGVSFGGLLAYETAQQLRRQGQEVAVLAIMDVILPRALRFSRVRWALSHVKRLVSSDARGLTRVARSVFTSSRLAAAFRRMEIPAALLGGDPDPGHDAAHLALDARRQRVYRQASVAYEQQIQPYDGSAVVFLARDEAEALIGYEVAPDCGWKDLVRGELRHHVVPGDHLGILKEPNVSRLAQLLGSYMKRASALIPLGFIDSLALFEQSLAQLSAFIERASSLGA